MQEALIRQLAARGYRARIVSIRRLGDLQTALAGQRRQGLLDEDFYQECLTRFRFQPPESLPEARSLIVVAFRDAQARFYFNWEGRRIPVVVPATYLHWRNKFKQAEAVVTGLLAGAGYRVAPLLTAAKRLAVCSGLAAYGRNNIAYVEGMGSFHRLTVFCSDLPCEVDPWREPQAMARCEGCMRCLQACPTGAIDPQRFLLRAERCLTFWNEKPGQAPFPEWVKAEWHNALVGCIHCQRVCPENREFLGRYEEAGEFSEEETVLLLQGEAKAELPADLTDKLADCDLLHRLGILARNLRALLDQRPA